MSHDSPDSPWAPFETRRRARDLKRDAVLRAAASMFLEVGYHRAKLDDVAEQLNITKPALYNYFASKADILVECYRRGLELIDQAVEAIEGEDANGLSRLRSLIVAYARIMTSEFGRCLVRLDDRELSPKDRKEVREGLRRCDSLFRLYIAQGIRDGSIVECDPKLTAFMIAGSLNWIGRWYNEKGDWTVDRIASDYSLQLTTGIARHPPENMPGS